MPNSDIIRLKSRQLRKPGHDEPTTAITVHAFCPCTVTGLLDETYSNIDEAKAAAAELGAEVNVCKRSNLPSEPVAEEPEPVADEASADEASADEPEGDAPAEPVADETPADEPEGEQVTTDQTEADEEQEPVTEQGAEAELSTLAARIAEPGMSRDEVQATTRLALATVIADYTEEGADRAADVSAFSIDNMDNAGSRRRDGLQALVTELGGASDAYGVKNSTGSGIYTFTVDVYAPAFVVTALDVLVPVITSACERLLGEFASEMRSALRELEIAEKDLAKGVADARRDWIAAFWAEIASSVAKMTDAAGVTLDLSVHETSAKESASARRKRPLKTTEGAES